MDDYPPGVAIVNVIVKKKNSNNIEEFSQRWDKCHLFYPCT
jgi:hypothetical protein